MEYPENSQEMNETLDYLHREYGQYILINKQKGSVVWFTEHHLAVCYQQQYGGVIINTATADHEFVQRSIKNALNQT